MDRLPKSDLWWLWALLQENVLSAPVALRGKPFPLPLWLGKWGLPLAVWDTSAACHDEALRPRGAPRPCREGEPDRLCSCRPLSQLALRPEQSWFDQLVTMTPGNCFGNSFVCVFLGLGMTALGGFGLRGFSRCVWDGGTPEAPGRLHRDGRRDGIHQTASFGDCLSFTLNMSLRLASPVT